MSRPPPVSLTIVVSPYHLTTREPPALAAILLADRVVTLLPVPRAGTAREDIAGAVERSPRYLRLMESWRWSMPLWRQGVISASHEGERIADDLFHLYEGLENDEALAALRPLLRRRPADNPDEMLDLLAADILKGGPDPAVSIPIAAALDRFAARRGVLIARSSAASVAQKAESRLGKRLHAFAVPIVLQASATRLLALRDRLANHLAPLRRALAEPRERASITDAAAAYTSAFESLSPSLTGGDDEEGRRIITGFVSITATELPGDIVLLSSLAAARAVGAAAPAGEPARVGGTPCLTALVIKPMTVKPDPASPAPTTL